MHLCDVLRILLSGYISKCHVISTHIIEFVVLSYEHIQAESTLPWPNLLNHIARYSFSTVNFSSTAILIQATQNVHLILQKKI